MTGVLQEEKICKNIQRKEGSVKTEAEIGVIFSQIWKHLGPPEARRYEEGFFPHISVGS